VTKLKRGAGTPVWSQQGDRLAFAANVDVDEVAAQEGQPDEKGKQPRVRLVTRVRYKADGEGFRQATRKHIFVVDLQAGEPRQLTDGDEVAFGNTRFLFRTGDA
jgi:dipeptidyl aminopeptidase/acylaminoacyl peptidase